MTRTPGNRRTTRSHGLSYTPEYRAWQTMRLRCTNPENKAWPDYGGRGIRVCDRWIDSVEAFVADMGPKPSPKHELDRVDNDGNYEPGNCRWVLRATNSRNRRSNKLITFRGETRCFAEWCELLDLNARAVSKRLKAGWSVERSFLEPVRTKSPNGKPKPQKTPCQDCSKPSYGLRCKSCENRARWADGRYGRANYAQQQNELAA